MEGNIGSGKSTFLAYCGLKPGVDAFPEPVDKWTDVGRVNLLVSSPEQGIRVQRLITSPIFPGQFLRRSMEVCIHISNATQHDRPGHLSGQDLETTEIYR